MGRGLGSGSVLKMRRSNRIDQDLGCGVKGDGSCHFLLRGRWGGTLGEEQGLASAVTSLTSSGSAVKTADVRVILWGRGQPPVVFARQTRRPRYLRSAPDEKRVGPEQRLSGQARRCPQPSDARGSLLGASQWGQFSALGQLCPSQEAHAALRRLGTPVASTVQPSWGNSLNTAGRGEGHEGGGGSGGDPAFYSLPELQAPSPDEDGPVSGLQAPQCPGPRCGRSLGRGGNKRPSHRHMQQRYSRQNQIPRFLLVCICFSSGGRVGPHLDFGSHSPCAPLAQPCSHPPARPHYENRV